MQRSWKADSIRTIVCQLTGAIRGIRRCGKESWIYANLTLPPLRSHGGDEAVTNRIYLPGGTICGWASYISLYWSLHQLNGHHHRGLPIQIPHDQVANHLSPDYLPPITINLQPSYSVLVAFTLLMIAIWVRTPVFHTLLFSAWTCLHCRR